jgi:hypothetical protein
MAGEIVFDVLTLNVATTIRPRCAPLDIKHSGGSDEVKDKVLKLRRI